LSLCNNKITKIENLRDCKKLKILSLGNNQIAQLDQVKVLRELPDLQVLNLAGNPMYVWCSNRKIRNEPVLVRVVESLDLFLFDVLHWPGVRILSTGTSASRI